MEHLLSLEVRKALENWLQRDPEANSESQSTDHDINVTNALAIIGMLLQMFGDESSVREKLRTYLDTTSAQQVSETAGAFAGRIGTLIESLKKQ